MPAWSAMSLTLPPAEKILPSPVRMTARTAVSALALSTAFSNAVMTSLPVIAFPTLGRLIVQVWIDSAPLISRGLLMQATVGSRLRQADAWVNLAGGEDARLPPAKPPNHPVLRRVLGRPGG